MQVQSTQAQERRKSPAEPVIPSVRGEFYSYSTQFSVDRPLAYLMKCKANKARPINEAELINHEIDLAFVFGNPVLACTPKALEFAELVGDRVIAEDLVRTMIAPAGITEERFYQLRQQKDGETVKQVCREAAQDAETAIALSQGMILSVATESGKYGLLLVKEITVSSVKVDACHILL